MSKSLKKNISNYWDRQPCNIKHSFSEIYTKKFFNEISYKRYFVEKHIKKFAEFEKYKNKKVLEIGFGIGSDAEEFIKNGAKYTGIEFSKNSLDITKKRIKVLKLDKMKPILIFGEAEKISEYFNNNTKFDLIYSFGVLHHTVNIKKCFDEIHKISSKNTKIKIMLYAANSYKNFIQNHSAYRYEAQKGVPIVNKYSHEEVRNLLKNKFKIISANQDFIFPYKINDYKKNIYNKIEHFKMMPKNIFRQLEKNIGEHLLLDIRAVK